MTKKEIISCASFFGIVIIGLIACGIAWHVIKEVIQKIPPFMLQ